MALEYEIHLPEYLSKCINQDRPQLLCNGQCVLMEKIKEKEKEEKNKNLVVYEYSTLYVHKEYTVFTMPQPKEQIDQRHFSAYLIDYTFNYNTPIFHPPIS